MSLICWGVRFFGAQIWVDIGLLKDALGRAGADTIDIGQRRFDAFLCGNFNTLTILGITISYPLRCLWRGFLLQITRTTFLRFTILHASQSLLTDGRTFMVHETKNAEPISALAMRKVIRPFDKS